MKFKKVKNEKEERNLIFVSISSEVFFPFSGITQGMQCTQPVTGKTQNTVRF